MSPFPQIEPVVESDAGRRLQLRRIVEALRATVAEQDSGVDLVAAAKIRIESLADADFGLRISGGTKVGRIRPDGDRWIVETDADTWRGLVVVIATGQYREPVIPSWPGRTAYRGRLLHSVEYRNAVPFQSQRVLVVGAGNSGAEVATDLVDHGAAAVAISIRTPPPIVPRDSPRWNVATNSRHRIHLALSSDSVRPRCCCSHAAARNLDCGRMDSRSAKTFAVSPCPLPTRHYACFDALALERRDGAEDVHLQLPDRRSER